MSGKKTALAQELEKLEKLDPQMSQLFIDRLAKNMDPETQSLLLTKEDLYTMKNRPKEGPGSFQREPGQKVWWVDTSGWDGLFLFSFDRKKVYNLFRDYPHKLTDREKAIFDRENPFWADFFQSKEN